MIHKLYERVKEECRSYFWRVLGISYVQVLRNHDFVYLTDDVYSSVGLRSYENGAKVWRWSEAKLIVGKFCSIANNVNFIVDDGSHCDSEISSFPFLQNFSRFSDDDKMVRTLLDKERSLRKTAIANQGIVIGNDVWIGMGTYIMPGVIIGNGVTIGANSVVTKNIPDYCVAAGSPAKVIKMKHEPEVIQQLLRIKWWDWPEEAIRERIEDFYIPIDTFLLKYKV